MMPNTCSDQSIRQRSHFAPRISMLFPASIEGTLGLRSRKWRTAERSAVDASSLMRHQHLAKLSETRRTSRDRAVTSHQMIHEVHASR
ncbi:unnamed protein product, partial [Mycena citricolor]